MQAIVSTENLYPKTSFSRFSDKKSLIISAKSKIIAIFALLKIKTLRTNAFDYRNNGYYLPQIIIRYILYTSDF